MSSEIGQGEPPNDSGRVRGIVPQADVHDHEQRNAGRQARSRAHRGFVAADVALAAMQDAPPIDAARFRRDLDALADQDSEPRF